MKKYIVFIVALFLVSSTNLFAQNRTLKQVMELQMPKTADDDFCGTRGAGVCWNPITKKYYAAFCGNTDFPMAVFTPAGKRISGDSLTTMEDIRGIWFNPSINRIMANCYSEIGWINYELNSAGIPTTNYYKFTGMNQPNEQSAGSYYSLLKSVVFRDGNQVVLYQSSADAAEVKESVQIHWGRKKSQGAGEDDEDVSESYNSNVVATNIKNAEFGFLNTANRQIELYNYNDGYLQQTLKLPESAPLESSFNFAYSNGIYWLFDIANRKWIGYK
ncbi:MAG: hypothetical protein IPI88_09035 [Chitinophagaceae bacterium]|nr:hypothetical protein [Chitinophagaceae bacterium]